MTVMLAVQTDQESGFYQGWYSLLGLNSCFGWSGNSGEK
jgi:hypothetical protein